MTHPVFTNTVAGDLAIGFSMVQHPTGLGRLSEPARRPRRGGGNLCDGAPSLLRPRADSQGARWEEDGEFRECRELLLLGVPGSPPFPLRGRPPYDAMFPTGDPPRRVARPTFAIDLNHVPPNQTFARSQASDPVTATHSASGAKKATQHNLRTVGVDCDLQAPKESKDYELQTLPNAPSSRKARVAG